MGSQPAPGTQAVTGTPSNRRGSVEERGLRGLPPFVDVVYGAVFGYGVFEIARAVEKFQPKQAGNATPMILLIAASVYLLFDYAQARMFTERHPYQGLTRFTLDVAIAVAFTFTYITAAKPSPNYLLTLGVILTLGAWWVAAGKSEYPEALKRSRFIIICHLAAAFVLIVIWGLGLVRQPAFAAFWHAWVNRAVGLLYLLYCLLLTIVTYGTRATEVERSLLPIIPLYGPWRHFKVRFNRLFDL